MIYREVPCGFCRKKFLRKTGQINEALKFGWRQYCSWKCLSADKVTGITKVCPVCGKAVYRTPSDFKKNKSGEFFCSRSCSAIFNNHLRGNKRPKLICKAKNCNNTVSRDSVYCSRKCAVSVRKKDKIVVAKEVLMTLKKFECINGRIPVKKEMYGLYKKARNVFGTWNNAIEAAGFKPNPVMFAKKYLASDGHKCDSLAEKIVDEWLHSKGISHERSVPYPEFERMTCDFVVNDFYIEFFGLEGEHRGYTKLVNKKRRLSKKYGIKLIEIKPSYLFPKNKLNQILNFLI